MKKAIKHIWKYITDPTYRSMIDLIAVSKAYSDAWKAIQEKVMLANHPQLIVEPKDLGTSFNMYDPGFTIKSYGYKEIIKKTKFHSISS